FIDRLTGARLAVPERRGKFLWIPVEPQGFVPIGGPATETQPIGTNREGSALVVHLGMSGQVLLRDPGAERDRLTRIVLDVEQPAHGPVRVDFVDQRIFGSMALDGLVPARDHP